MLQPKRTKFRKAHKGRNRGIANKGNSISACCTFGIKATTFGFLTSRQIEAARRTIARCSKRAGNLLIRPFPDKPITKKPEGNRMGSGKGSIVGYVAPVQPGKILFEIGGVSEELAREAFKLAGAKLPVKTIFVLKTVL